MGLLQQKPMKWRDFERVCEELVKRCFPNDHYRVRSQGILRRIKGRMDILISERRPGGKRYVIECKHYPKSPLPKRAVKQVVNYKRKDKASKGILLISGATKRFAPGFDAYANDNKVLVLRVSTLDYLGLVSDIQNFFGVEKELKRIIC